MTKMFVELCSHRFVTQPLQNPPLCSTPFWDIIQHISVGKLYRMWGERRNRFVTQPLQNPPLCSIPFWDIVQHIAVGKLYRMWEERRNRFVTPPLQNPPLCSSTIWDIIQHIAVGKLYSASIQIARIQYSYKENFSHIFQLSPHSASWEIVSATQELT